jgi:hypothetical protein
MAAYSSGFLGNEIGLVNLDTGQILPPLREDALGSGGAMLMVTPLVLAVDKSTLSIWHWPKRLRVLNETVPEALDWSYSDNQLISYAPGRKPFAIAIDPDMLAHQLCRLSDREFTPDEISLLPEGTSHERPCADIR